MKRKYLFKIIFVGLVLFTIQNVSAHPMGLAVCNLKYSNGNLSFSTRLFYSDFYYEFQETSKVKNKDYVKSGFDKTDEKDMYNYFRKHIKIWCNNKLVKYKTISFKFEEHDTGVYIFIVTLNGKVHISKGDKIKIRDTVMLKSIGGQQQLINVYLNGTDIPSRSMITLDKNHPEYGFVNE